MTKKNQPLVSIIMGSDSDLRVMREAGKVCTEFNVPFEMKIVSAHRTPKEMVHYAEYAAKRGIRVIIAAAGGAAHLPGMVASLCTLPVIGVPINITALKGLDALLSIAQMPKGIPVATVAIDNSTNAALLAVRILAFTEKGDRLKLSQRLASYQSKQRKKVLAKKI